MLQNVRITTNEVIKHKTSVNDVAKHKTKSKITYEAYKQWQLRLFSTRTMPIEVVKHTNKGKFGS